MNMTARLSSTRLKDNINAGRLIDEMLFPDRRVFGMDDRIVNIITLESKRNVKGNFRKRFYDMAATSVIGIYILLWVLILIALFIFWLALSNKSVENVYSEYEVTYVDYAPGLSRGEDCTVKVKEVIKKTSITEREYAPRKTVNYHGETGDLTQEEDRGEMIDRAYYWIRDDKGNTGVLFLEGAQIDRFEKLKTSGELYETTLYGEIVERSITTGYDVDDISTKNTKKANESVKLSQELEGETIMHVNFGKRSTKRLKYGEKTVYPRYFIPSLIALIVVITLYLFVKYGFKNYFKKGVKESEEDEIVFEEISKLLRKRLQMENTPEEENMCLFIRQLLNNKDGWYAIHAKTITEILIFLGVESEEKRQDMYEMIHFPMNEAMYGGRDLIFMKKNQGSDHS